MELVILDIMFSSSNEGKFCFFMLLITVITKVLRYASQWFLINIAA